ncbi:unnamed protein product [Wickerhamomyces anomalus]
MSDFIYTNVERALLQYIISVGSAREESLTSVHTKLKQTDDEDLALIDGLKERRLDETIEKINDKLHLLGYEIAKAKSQETQEINYVFINTIADAPAKISTTHSPKEIEVIKKIIEKIIVECEDESFVITSSEALKICSRSAQLSASEGEHLLRELVVMKLLRVVFVVLVIVVLLNFIRNVKVIILEQKVRNVQMMNVLLIGLKMDQDLLVKKD